MKRDHLEKNSLRGSETGEGPFVRQQAGLADWVAVLDIRDREDQPVQVHVGTRAVGHLDPAGIRAVGRLDRVGIRAVGRLDRAGIRVVGRLDRAGIRVVGRLDRAGIRVVGRLDRAGIRVVGRLDRAGIRVVGRLDRAGIRVVGRLDWVGIRVVTVRTGIRGAVLPENLVAEVRPGNLEAARQVLVEVRVGGLPGQAGIQAEEGRRDRRDWVAGCSESPEEGLAAGSPEEEARPAAVADRPETEVGHPEVPTGHQPEAGSRLDQVLDQVLDLAHLAAHQSLEAERSRGAVAQLVGRLKVVAHPEAHPQAVQADRHVRRLETQEPVLVRVQAFPVHQMEQGLG
jgi:hypothetical protein